MDKLPPYKIISTCITGAFDRIALPPTNNARTQRALADLYIASAMKSRGTSTVKKVTDELKKVHKEAIAKAVVNDPLELERCAPFMLTVKVGNPKQVFDLDKFIKEIADKYDLSMSLLTEIADDCKKIHQSSKSFEVILMDNPEQPI